MVGLNVATFGAQHLVVGDRPLLEWAVPDGDAIGSGEVWRPFSSLFVHPGGSMHLGINSGLLLVVGPIAEPMLGKRRFVCTYVLGGTATNALRYLVGGRDGGGASAAICAVAGAAVARETRRRGRENGRAVRTAAAVVTAAGLWVARRTGDNHVLALGIGALMPSGPAAQLVRGRPPPMAVALAPGDMGTGRIETR